MKQTDGFYIKKIHDIPYLLPAGQRIAEQRRGIRLNESSEWIWNQIPLTKNKEELFLRLCDYYHATPQVKDTLESDMNAFLDQLKVWGMIYETEDSTHSQTGSDYKIAGLTVRIHAPSELIADEFEPFFIQSTHSPDLLIDVLPSSGLLAFPSKGQLLIHTNELLICDQDTEYQIFFPMSPQIQECRLKKDGSYACFHVIPPYRNQLRSDLFHAIRLVYLYLAERHGHIAIHSASIDYQGKAWLFTGASGTGKSTHTNLWHRYFDTPVINGDLNLVTFSNNTPMVHGIPWCGTSGISDTGSRPVGGILFLRQSKDNVCRHLSESEKVLGILQRSISPMWTEAQLDVNLQLAHSLSTSCFVARLYCNKEKEAAEYMKSQIDQVLKEQTYV